VKETTAIFVDLSWDARSARLDIYHAIDETKPGNKPLSIIDAARPPKRG
jgi:hypothetical protein